LPIGSLTKNKSAKKRVIEVITTAAIPLFGKRIDFYPCKEYDAITPGWSGERGAVYCVEESLHSTEQVAG
jgi:hypothetical protein